MAKRLWRDSRGFVWIVSNDGVTDVAGTILDPPVRHDLKFELPKGFAFSVTTERDVPPELIPDDELEAIVQERYYSRS